MSLTDIQKKQEFARSDLKVLKIFEDTLGVDLIPFSCGRAVLVLALRCLNLNRMDEILVPPFMCQAVLSALSRSVFPTMTFSNRTKAILVYHQFGFPQKIDEIESLAQKKGWIIVNDACNTLFSEYYGRKIIEWGDFGLLSFPKIYSCALGGAFFSKNQSLKKEILGEYLDKIDEHQLLIDQVYEQLVDIFSAEVSDLDQVEIQKIYGGLPSILSFPSKALLKLPKTMQEIMKDVERRENIFQNIRALIPEMIPEVKNCRVVPTAIPIKLSNDRGEDICKEILHQFSIQTTILHFDFNMNMLNPRYEKSVIINLQKDYTQDQIEGVCQYFKKNN